MKLTHGLQMKDCLILEGWLRSGATPDEVCNIPRIGLLDNERFTERARSLYLLICEWSAIRFSSQAQNDLHWRSGNDAVCKRIRRCRKLIERSFPGATKSWSAI